MGGGAATGTELLSDETSAEVAKLSETARKELEAKKKLADEENRKLAEELADERKHARSLTRLAEENAELQKKKLEGELAEEKKKLADELADEKKKLAEENERLRAELKKEQPPPASPVKQPLSEADAKAVRKIEAQARKEDEEAYCTFEVLDKHQLLDFPEGALLPKYQDIKRDHPTMLVPFKISFAEACAGVHVNEILTISHRWMSREIADTYDTSSAKTTRTPREAPASSSAARTRSEERPLSRR